MNKIESIKNRARNLKMQISAIYYAYSDKRVKCIPKLIIGFAILYTLSPIDLIPDFIPVLGYLDDLLIIPALIALAIRLIPKHIMEEARKKAEDDPITLKENWFFAIIFICLWILMFYFMIKGIIRIIRK